MEDMTLNNSAANAEVNMNESTSVNENVSVGTDTPTVLPESPVIGFQAVDAEGNVLGFVSKAELVNEAKQALYADLAILEANRPTTLPANDMLAATSTLAATDVYEDQLAIKSDAPYIRGLDATGNPIRISKADLASVVGGLLKILTSTDGSSFFYRRESTDITDLDVWLPDGGFNFVRHNASTSPEGGGLALIYKYNKANKLQIFISMGSYNGRVGSIYYRAWHESYGFSKWKKVTSTDFNIG